MLAPLLLLAIAASISLYLAYFAWRYQRHYVFFILLMVATAIWSIGYGIEILSTTKSMKVLCAKMEYVGIVFIPVSWFATVLQYTGKGKWLTRKGIAILMIIPAITLFLVWTNGMHHLIWKKVEIVHSSPYPFAIFTHGPFFWIHVGYSYALIFLSILFLSYAFFSLPQIYRSRIVALIFGAIVPWIGNIFYVTSVNPFQQFDLTPLTVFLSGVTMAWAVLRMKLLGIKPVAREALIEIMEDGIVVMDSSGQIIEANPSARKLMENGEARKKIEEAFRESRKGYEREVEINGGYYYIRVSPIKDEDGEIGKLMIIHDITKRKKAENKIRQLNEELKLINKIVRHDILNDLQIIQGFLEMDYGGNKEIYDKLMKRIEKSVRLMKRAKDLEYIALPSNEIKEYDMKEVIENVARSYDVKVNIKGNCRVKADEAIYSVIDNIIMNAIIHGKADTIDVIMESGNGCTIKIADNGGGIPDEIKDRIFEEKFSYGEAGGSGLGLYIVKKLIEKYGWEINVEKNEPSGAVFIIKTK